MTQAALIHAIFLLSGVAGLGYELIWTRAFSVGLGHEYPSALAVVAAFFAGLALGAAALDRWIARSAHPGAWYAACELVIGVWAAASAWTVPILNKLVGGWIGLAPSALWQGTVAFAVPFLALLPATAAMGATLPAMERLLARLRSSGRVLSGLYAINTLGAAIGVLGSVFLLIPLFGLTRSLFAFAAINLACAVLTWVGPARGEARRGEPPGEAADREPSAARMTLGVLFLTGLLGVGYEVAMLRVLSQCFENTVFSFAAALAVYLVAAAAGAALFHAFSSESARDAERLKTWLPAALAVVCAIQVLAIPALPNIHDNALSRAGGGIAAAMMAESLTAAAALWCPALLMGALFAVLAQAARTARGGVGAALALNTFGGALAPLVIGAAAIPALGLRWTLATVAGGYLLPLLARRPIVAAIAGLCVLAISFAAPSLDRLALPAGVTPIATREGMRATALVGMTAEREHVLRVNRTFQMGSTGRGAFAELRQGHLPLLLHPAPRTALFLGLGTAITFAATGEYPELEADGVELLPEVVELLPYFRPDNASVLDSPQRRIWTADARRFVAAQTRQYDVIVADLFHPALDGAASLYTVEHFSAIRARLAPGGLFAQWLPLHQLDAPTLGLILRSYREAFGGGSCFWGVFNIETPMLAVVCGRDTPVRWRSEAEYPTSREYVFKLGKLDLQDGPLSVWGTYAGELDELLGEDRAGPLNTDDHPRVLFAAPAQAYRNESAGPTITRLLLKRTRESRAAPAMAAREDVAAYRRARDLFLEGLIARDEQRLRDAGAKWLESAQASEKFGPAYLSLVSLAKGVATQQPELAKEWLRAAMQVRPKRNEAGMLLSELERKSGGG